MNSLLPSPYRPPFFPLILAAAYFGSGRYEDAIASARDVLKRDKDNLGAFLILASANAVLDRQAEAARAASEIRRIKPDFTIKTYAETQPYKDPEKLKQLSNLLQKSGLK